MSSVPKALVTLLTLSCSGPAFEAELFSKKDSKTIDSEVRSDVRDGGVSELDTPDAIVSDAFDGTIVLETGTIDAQDADCSNRHLTFVGTPGSFAKFSAPRPLTVFAEASVLLRPGDSALAIEYHAPENPCGFSLTIYETTVKATLPAQFDHYAPVQIAGTGWRHVRWSFDGDESKIWIDGQLEAAQKFVANFVACSGPVLVGGISIPGSAPHSWNKGQIDDLVVGGYHWQFDEPSGAALLGNPGPPGTLQGDVRRDCGP